MNKIAATVVEKKVKETASAISEAAEEMITMSRRTHTLEILVALLGGIVIGMFLSPRKKVSYKIASNNHDIGNTKDPRIGAADEDDDEYDADEDEEDEDNYGADDADENVSAPADIKELETNDKFIKL